MHRRGPAPLLGRCFVRSPRWLELLCSIRVQPSRRLAWSSRPDPVPVMSRTCSTAWWSSISSPATAWPPAAHPRSDQSRRPRRVRDIQQPSRFGGNSPRERCPRRGWDRAHHDGSLLSGREPIGPAGDLQLESEPVGHLDEIGSSLGSPGAHHSIGTAQPSQRGQRRGRGRSPAQDHRRPGLRPDPAQGLDDPDDVRVVADQALGAEDHGVGAARPRSTSSLALASSGSTARFNGIVSESPAHSGPHPARNPASPAESTSIAS